MLTLKTLTAGEYDSLRALIEDFVSSHGTLRYRSDYWTSFKDWLGRLSREQNALALVADDDGATVGLAIGLIQENGPLLSPDKIGYVSLVVVSPVFRRRGVGGALWRGIEQWFLSNGIREVQLYTEVGNQASREFWSQLGFTSFLERRRIILTDGVRPGNR